MKVNERIGKSVLKLSKGPWIKIFRIDAQTLKGEKRGKSDFSMLDNSTLFTFVACTEILAFLPNLH